MDNYEKDVELNIKRNEKFINEFEEWLREKHLTEKTIKKHINNIYLYLNDFLNYYEIIQMEKGVYRVYEFLGDWFIRKCLWASKNSIKENAASIKKFYKCMSIKEYVSIEEYELLCDDLREEMDIYLESLEDYDNGIYYQ